MGVFFTLNFRNSREIGFLERMVRVEEGLKSTNELMKQGFNLTEKRFEQFEKRFEQVDKRFSRLQWTIGLGFTVIAALMSVFNFF